MMTYGSSITTNQEPKSRIQFARWMPLAFCLALFAVVTSFGLVRQGMPLGDLHYRYNEIRCSHCGVNPFRIWAREIQFPPYRGIAWPGEDFVVDSSVAVHSYPPWHTTFCWFYGWLDFSACAVLITGLSVLCFLLIVHRLAAFQPVASWKAFVFWCILLIPLLSPFVVNFQTGQYGAVYAGLVLLFFWSLDHDRSILAGLVWALMMVKPQIGVLFAWPLLFGRKFLTMASAVLVCLLATLVPAFVYHCSPFDLILQIPQAESPYNYVGVLKERLPMFLFHRPFSPMAWSCAWFLACGALAYVFRRASGWMLRCLPVIFIIPVWNYSNAYDWLILWPWLLCLALICLREIRLPAWLWPLFVGYTVLLVLGSVVAFVAGFLGHGFQSMLKVAQLLGVVLGTIGACYLARVPWACNPMAAWHGRGQ